MRSKLWVGVLLALPWCPMTASGWQRPAECECRFSKIDNFYEEKKGGGTELALAGVTVEGNLDGADSESKTFIVTVTAKWYLTLQCQDDRDKTGCSAQYDIEVSHGDWKLGGKDALPVDAKGNEVPPTVVGDPPAPGKTPGVVATAACDLKDTPRLVTTTYTIKLRKVNVKKKPTGGEVTKGLEDGTVTFTMKPAKRCRAETGWTMKLVGLKVPLAEKGSYNKSLSDYDGDGTANAKDKVGKQDTRFDPSQPRRK